MVCCMMDAATIGRTADHFMRYSYTSRHGDHMVAIGREVFILNTDVGIPS